MTTMKKRTPTGFIFILLSAIFTNVPTGQEYTYLLKVTLLRAEEQSFDMEINSRIGSSEPITIVLADCTTPFKRILKIGNMLQ